MNVVNKKIEEELLTQLEDIKSLTAGSEEKARAAETIKVFNELRNDHNKYERYIKLGLDALNVVGSAAIYLFVVNTTFKAEGLAIFPTSAVWRNTLSSLKLPFGKR